MLAALWTADPYLVVMLAGLGLILTILAAAALWLDVESQRPHTDIETQGDESS
ncbi:hypothetical protein [Nonomuraea endophytica]|uniref:Uncharacterized protein n=1 Tax=Nonomuraea endophytica TaxID=714136 RepID=A0A7W8A860_9ACTN|nr:hypothetical protein [Nonomuraea endophytica]MBB5081329.1 hypothetical protein [Nonomuraea endophytica]